MSPSLPLRRNMDTDGAELIEGPGYHPSEGGGRPSAKAPGGDGMSSKALGLRIDGVLQDWGGSCSITDIFYELQNRPNADARVATELEMQRALDHLILLGALRRYDTPGGPHDDLTLPYVTREVTAWSPDPSADDVANADAV